MKTKPLKKFHTQHRDQVDCGVVCLQTVLKYYGSHCTLEKLREYSGTSSHGTTMLGMLQCGCKLPIFVTTFNESFQS